MPVHTIIHAYDAIESVKELFHEYVHEEYELKLNVTLAFQNIDEEIKNLPGEYGVESGGLFLAYCDKKLAGCGAFRKLNGTSCELKRLYVRKQYRGQGLGRKILLHLMHEAKKKGYMTAYFDTLRSMHEAIILYETIGFAATEAYNDNPLPDVIFFKKEL